MSQPYQYAFVMQVSQDEYVFLTPSRSEDISRCHSSVAIVAPSHHFCALLYCLRLESLV